MFTRTQPPIPGFQAGMSIPPPPPPVRSRTFRTMKFGIVLLLLLAGGGALLTNMQYITTDNAVVTTRVVTLRSPIEGTLRWRQGMIGQSVEKGYPVADVENRLIDDRGLRGMRLQAERLAKDVEGLRSEEQALLALRDDLNQRVARHRGAKLAQLRIEAARAALDHAMRAEALAQLSRDAGRRTSLHGVVAEAEIEHTVSAMRVGTVMAAISAQQAKEADVVAQAEQDGVLIEPNGSNDVAYSQQRADEVLMRIIANQRLLAGAEADLAAMQGRLEAEEDHFAKYQQATVFASSSGMIWRSGATEGERVRPGDPIIQTVDCGSAVLAVAVPLERMADIDFRVPAIVRFSGSQQTVEASIIATQSDTALRDDKAMAVIPTPGSRPTGVVVLQVPPSPNDLGQCLVGHTARVKLSVIHTGLAAHLQRLAPF